MRARGREGGTAASEGTENGSVERRLYLDFRTPERGERLKAGQCRASTTTQVSPHEGNHTREHIRTRACARIAT